ncbi:MAG: hypothetical protein JRH10_13605, partial [Deltaproteobacteria bacterium]|nr:hypothetical protein [Deltaproteobacteria bacterium]
METTHDAHLFTHRRAHRRAAWRMHMNDTLLRYLVVTGLLLLLVRPIGVIVAIFWGLGIARRFLRGQDGLRRQRRAVRREMRRCGHGRCAEADAPPRRARPEVLAEQMGDDPGTERAVDWARSALDELADAERVPRPEAVAGVNVSDLVEDVVEVCEDRAARDGITFRLELDAEGEIESDATRLKAVLLDLVNESVRGLRRGAQGPARVTVQMGENLAGSEVWVRVRDDRLDAASGARGRYGSRPVPGIAGATLETQASPRNGVEKILTLKKGRLQSINHTSHA